jgi:hypothetical protein
MPTATSSIELCNLAPTRLGHGEISSFPAVPGYGKAGRLCNLHYGPTRDVVLRTRLPASVPGSEVHAIIKASEVLLGVDD